MSERGDAASPHHSSGARYAGVPIMVPLCVMLRVCAVMPFG